MGEAPTPRRVSPAQSWILPAFMALMAASVTLSAVWWGHAIDQLLSLEHRVTKLEVHCPRTW